MEYAAQGMRCPNLHAETGIANLVMYAAGPAIITGHPNTKWVTRLMR